jgi:hypothetical protein
MVKLIGISPSDKAGKKYMAKFETEAGRTKTTHFGAAGMSDFTKHRDEARKASYIARHSANENFSNPTSAGALSRWVLWNKPTLSASIADYKKKFGF